jgi:hypothetical protein
MSKRTKRTERTKRTKRVTKKTKIKTEKYSRRSKKLNKSRKNRKRSRKVVMRGGDPTYTRTTEPLGSNVGGMFQGSDDKKYYIKAAAKPDIAYNEVLASRFYQAAKIPVANMEIIDCYSLEGDLRDFHRMMKKKEAICIGSEVIPMIKGRNTVPDLQSSPYVYAGFAMDAWLADWDVIGYRLDNIQIGEDGRAYRVDVGGSLEYRAQGQPKWDSFSNHVSEIVSMRNPHAPTAKYQPGKNAADVFSGMSDEEVILSAEGTVLTFTLDDIKRIVEGVYGEGQKGSLIQKLINRQTYIREYIDDLKRKRLEAESQARMRARKAKAQKAQQVQKAQQGPEPTIKKSNLRERLTNASAKTLAELGGLPDGD